MNELYGYAVHPAADIFPMMTDAELQELAEDISAHGLQLPLTLTHDGILVDGRNRLAACRIANVDHSYHMLPEDYTDEQILNTVVSTNIRRRHLTAGQKAMIAAALEPMYAEAMQVGRPKSGEEKIVENFPQFSECGNKAREQAAAAVGGISGRSVSDAKALKQDTPDLAEMVTRGDMTLNAATKERKKRTAKPRTAKGPPPKHPRHDEVISLAVDELSRQEIADEINRRHGPSDPPFTARTVRRIEEDHRKLASSNDAVIIDFSALTGKAKEKEEKMRRQIRRELEAEIEAHVQARVKSEQEVLHNVSRQVQRTYDESRRILNARKGIMSRDDFDLIRSCLHPDSRLSATDEKLAAAFRIFNEADILLLDEKNRATSTLPATSEDLLKRRKA